MAVELRQAVEADLPRVEALVRSAGLMTEGLRDFFPAGFLVAADGEALLGVCGVEPRGRAGLLRSVAVADAARGTGLGRRLVLLAIERAGQAHLDALFLLTKTAPAFFTCFRQARRCHASSFPSSPSAICARPRWRRCGARAATTPSGRPSPRGA